MPASLVLPAESHTGRRLRALRGNLSLRKMASLVGCSSSYLCEIENGGKVASEEFLERIRLALGSGNLRGAEKPRKMGRPQLPAFADQVRSAFRYSTPSRPTQPLRQSFSLARYHPVGRELVEELDARRRPGIFWKAVKWAAGQMNGPEQGVFLRLLLPDGEMHEFHPRLLGFPLPIVEPPGHWWVAVTRRIDGRLLVAFPQFRVQSLAGSPRRLDFLIGMEGVGLLNLEVDGPEHRSQQTPDRIRAVELNLRTLRVGVQEIWRDDFFGNLVKMIQA